MGKDGYKNTHIHVLNNTYQHYRCGKSEICYCFLGLPFSYINKSSLQTNHFGDICIKHLFVSNERLISSRYKLTT